MRLALLCVAVGLHKLYGFSMKLKTYVFILVESFFFLLYESLQLVSEDISGVWLLFRLP